ncbi:MAG TPA: hypothetical protein VGH45_10630 [Solirubrobacteraceae bacterium]
MNDPPGVSSMLGIETVEWFAEGGENLTVRVTGRWRRRRPAWSAQPILVVEAAGRRFRFPAMPEPPSVTGAGPGMWRISFTVPAALAPELAGRTWLQLGAVVVPLPPAVEPLGRRSGEAPIEPEGSAVGEGERPASSASPPSSELEAEDARRRARETEDARRRALEAEDATFELNARVDALEGELASARLEVERLSASLSERERSRRTAEQRAHAAQAQRHELTRRLEAGAADAARAREALGDLAAAEERIRGLEEELDGARRRADEAEQAAAAATTARRRAEEAWAESAQRDRLQPSPGQADRLRLEHRLAQRRAGEQARVPSEPPPVSPRGSPEPSSPAPARTPGDDELLAALRRELEARAASEVALRARLLDAEGGLAARSLIERRTAQTLTQLRREFDGLRSAFACERAARLAAEQRAAELAGQARAGADRSRAAQLAIGELRQALEQLRAAPASELPGGPEAAGGPGLVEPERLNDARQRLRAAISPQPVVLGEGMPPATATATATTAAAAEVPEAERTSRSWLAPIWHRLAETESDLAGRLLVELLPAQREAYSEPVAYDLVFGGGRGCAQVTARDGAAVIRHAQSPRPRQEVDFQLIGDPGAIARWLIAGPLRRRLGRGVARVRGRRERLIALRSLIDVRLDFRGLHRIGVRFEPDLALRLIALMIDPAWTGHERFAVAYRPSEGPTRYLLIRDGAPAQVSTEAPASGVAATISGPGDLAALALAGERPDSVTVSGQEWPLALLRKWIKRAQSD